VCVEFEDESWESRSWIDIYGPQVQLFLVEHSLAVADRQCPSNPSVSVLCPAMVPSLTNIDPALIHVEIMHNYVDKVKIKRPHKRPTSETPPVKPKAKQTCVEPAPVKEPAQKPSFITYSRDDGKTLVVVDNPKSSGNSLLSLIKTADQGSSSTETTNGTLPEQSKPSTQDPLPPSSKPPSSSGSGPLSWLTNLPNTNVNKENKDNPFTSIVKTESKTLPSFASFGKPAASLQPFSTSILSPMSSNSSGFLRNLLNSSSIKENSEKSTPKLLDDIFASLVQTKPMTEPIRRPQGLAVQPSLMGFNTPHYWLCDNRLLCLQDPSNKSNWNVFRECWKQGQPVMVSGIHNKLNRELWRPESFRIEFGEQEADLVNCRTNDIITGATVHNLYSCIKVAEDFVSPEHVKHCFCLTQEFRYLSHTHTNHEDKLQKI
ncbi:hypothetical protein AB205_0199920, partial [Aquarana catesbeiana]